MPWLPENRLRVAELLGSRAIDAAAQHSTDAHLAVERAVSEYEELLAYAPLEYEATVMYANVLNGVVPVEGDSAAKRAITIARRAQLLFPQGLSAIVAEASALNSLGRYAEAASLLESNWGEDPEYLEPGIQYSYALWQVGQRDEALDVIDELEEAQPGDPRVAALRSYLASLSEE
ncbi:tetratricopeptide repeat protein [bacterium]|nr:tetratricopeptide repeat protein [bacterium]